MRRGEVTLGLRYFAGRDPEPACRTIGHEAMVVFGPCRRPGSQRDLRPRPKPVLSYAACTLLAGRVLAHALHSALTRAHSRLCTSGTRGRDTVQDEILRVIARALENLEAECDPAALE